MVTDERIEAKLDKISDKIEELVKESAVHEQKLREINHRIGDGQQSNVLKHELLRNEMTKRLDTIDYAVSTKVDIEDYKETLRDMKDTLAKDRKMLITISIILVTGSGVVANMEPVKKLLMHLLGLP